MEPRSLGRILSLATIGSAMQVIFTRASNRGKGFESTGSALGLATPRLTALRTGAMLLNVLNRVIANDVQSWCSGIPWWATLINHRAMPASLEADEIEVSC
jgi:hypothetical protein